MAYLKEKGYEARAFYLNILYLVLIILGGLAVSTLNAEFKYTKDGTEVSVPRYRRCYIDGTGQQYIDATTKGCIAIAGTEDTDGNFVPADDAAKDQLATMDALNGITIAVIVFNGLVGIHSGIMHFGGDAKKFGITYHFMFQWVISLINVGLFAGIVGHLNSVPDIQSDVNVANNLYYTEVNLFMVGVAGVIITTLDLIGSNMIVYCLCTAQNGYMCNTK
tara:strand:+ start:3677 stop:4336 length:660 start_codon:yes stop_codon:yes gene_type:complete